MIVGPETDVSLAATGSVIESTSSDKPAVAFGSKAALEVSSSDATEAVGLIGCPGADWVVAVVVTPGSVVGVTAGSAVVVVTAGSVVVVVTAGAVVVVTAASAVVVVTPGAVVDVLLGAAWHSPR